MSKETLGNKRSHSRLSTPSSTSSLGPFQSTSTQSNLGEVLVYNTTSSSSRRPSTGSERNAIESDDNLMNSTGIKEEVIGDDDDKTKFADKACTNCKKRKVKCGKQWPTCAGCATRGNDCDYGTMIPASAGGSIQIVEIDSGESSRARIKNLSDRLDYAEEELRALSISSPPPFSDTVRHAFVAGSLTQEDTYKFLERHLALTHNEHISELNATWALARSSFSRALVLHLLDSFFVSCCAYLPCFSPWVSRLDHIRENLDTLDPAMQSAVSAFCAMGARASPHSALLGIPVAAPGQAKFADFAASTAAGVRREQACRAIHRQSLDLLHNLEISYDTSILNLEALLVVMQMLIFNEVIHRKSRTLILIIINQFKEIQDSQLDPEVKRDVALRLALPILCGDSITSASARKNPLIQTYEIPIYFPQDLVQLPDFEKANMNDILEPLLSPKPSHNSLVQATTVIACWLAQAQRETAYLTQGSKYHESAGPDRIRLIWSAIDQIHTGIVKIQTFLVNASSKLEGCSDDPCSDLHLRFDTRLDRDLMDVIYLVHFYIQAKRADSKIARTNRVWETLFIESESRVRKSLKLTAFYSQLYISSQDHHMVYHVFFQLEILPYWTSLALQRHGESDGPASQDLEVSETELDWLEQGLLVATFYHPVAEARMKQLQAERRPPRNGNSTPESGTSVYDPADAIRQTSTAGNQDGSLFSMPQAISNLHDLNIQRGGRRFDTPKYYSNTEYSARTSSSIGKSQITCNSSGEHPFAEITSSDMNFTDDKKNGEKSEKDLGIEGKGGKGSGGEEKDGSLNGSGEIEEDGDTTEAEKSSMSPMEEWLSPQGAEAVMT